MGQPQDTRVLVLDGETRSALAVVRSLGAKGYQVAVASHLRNCVAGKSKYTDLYFQCPDPRTAPATYPKWLGSLVEQWQPEIVLPVTDASLVLAQKISKLIAQYSVMPVVSPSVLNQVLDKGSLAEVATGLGVLVPKTLIIPELRHWSFQTDKDIQEFPFPAVLKPRSSVVERNSKLESPPMFYVSKPEEVRDSLQQAFQAQSAFSPYILQQKISGHGIGVFALCMGGEVIMEFAHRRILEKPPSGGRSVLCESIALQDAPYQEAKTLLKHFRWQGIAMVEFKRSDDGRDYLMEINPRFWGSLQLAIDAGRDFPAALCELSLRESGAAGELRMELQKRYGDYAVGQRLRWLLGTLDHALIRLKQDPRAALRDIFLHNSLQIFKHRKTTHLEVLRKGDLKPFLCELRAYIAQLLGREAGESR